MNNSLRGLQGEYITSNFRVDRWSYLFLLCNDIKLYGKFIPTWFWKTDGPL